MALADGINPGVRSEWSHGAMTIRGLENRTDFSGAKLTRARLVKANLGGCDLSRAALDGASLQGAELRNAKIVGANLYGADLSGAVGLTPKVLCSAWTIHAVVGLDDETVAELSRRCPKVMAKPTSWLYQ